MHPLLILVALIVALLAFSWFKRLPPKRRRKLGFYGLLIGVGGILLLLLLSGRLHPLFALLAGLLPFVGRIIKLWNMANTLRSLRRLFSGATTTEAGTGAGTASGKTSEVRTRYFCMTLDHDSGTMDAEVLQGDFAGRTLSKMSMPELQRLLAQVKSDDPESAQLLLTWLERRYGDTFQNSQSQGAADSRMSLHRAREILGVAADANREQIILAHRRLMQKLHPDRGGSDYLAREINHAKKVLLSACDGKT